MEIRKILLAEDEADIRKVAQISLQFRGGWEVLLATDGEECLAKASQDRPDLILLDCMMPKLDGYETCRRLKQDPALREIPVIFLTAKAQEAEVRRGLSLGAVGYLIKPFNPMSLAAEIREILEGRGAVSSPGGDPQSS
jgi:CheY-like chemotaxis protein